VDAKRSNICEDVCVMDSDDENRYMDISLDAVSDGQAWCPYVYDALGLSGTTGSSIIVTSTFRFGPVIRAHGGWRWREWAIWVERGFDSDVCAKSAVQKANDIACSVSRSKGYCAPCTAWSKEKGTSGVQGVTCFTAKLTWAQLCLAGSYDAGVSER
jgi:hypothetical protein